MLRLLAAPAVALATLTAGCAGPGPSAGSGPVRVVAAFYPLEFVAARVGGADVRVSGLTKAGTEPHDLELSPQQVAAVRDADLVVRLGGFQPAVDEVVEQEAAGRSVDVADVAPLAQGFAPISDGELHDDERGADPHVWLDPRRVAGIADAVAERLAEVDPGRAASYRARSAALRTELTVLDEEFRAGLAGCARRELVTSHNAFGYLARAYGLEQIGITGLTPEEEPTPRRLAEVTDLARRRGVTTIFFEELVSPKVAESLAREVGAQARVLSPLESPPEEGDYFTAMRGNLAAIRTGLGCS